MVDDNVILNKYRFNTTHKSPNREQKRMMILTPLKNDKECLQILQDDRNEPVTIIMLQFNRFDNGYFIIP